MKLRKILYSNGWILNLPIIHVIFLMCPCLFTTILWIVGFIFEIVWLIWYFRTYIKKVIEFNNGKD